MTRGCGLKWSHDKGLQIVKGLKWSHDKGLQVVKGLNDKELLVVKITSYLSVMIT